MTTTLTISAYGGTNGTSSAGNREGALGMFFLLIVSGVGFPLLLCFARKACEVKSVEIPHFGQ